MADDKTDKSDENKLTLRTVTLKCANCRRATTVNITDGLPPLLPPGWSFNMRFVDEDAEAEMRGEPLDDDDRRHFHSITQYACSPACQEKLGQGN